MTRNIQISKIFVKMISRTMSLSLIVLFIMLVCAINNYCLDYEVSSMECTFKVADITVYCFYFEFVVYLGLWILLCLVKNIQSSYIQSKNRCIKQRENFLEELLYDLGPDISKALRSYLVGDDEREVLEASARLKIRE